MIAGVGDENAGVSCKVSGDSGCQCAQEALGSVPMRRLLEG